MAIVIQVSKERVFIPKYDLQFQFIFPSQKLKDVTLKTYDYLKQSIEFQLESTREERNEAMTLLKEFGSALFHSLIPPDIESELKKLGVVYIQPLCEETEELPWELLFNGNVFISLTQGVSRISGDKIITPQKTTNLQKLPKLAISFHSASPIPKRTSKIVYHLGIHEEIPLNYLGASPYISWNFCCNSTKTDFVETLSKSPNLLIYSGQITKSGFLFEDINTGNANEVNFNELAFHFKKAAHTGTKIVIISPSSFTKEAQINLSEISIQLLDSDIAVVLSIGGKLGRDRIRRYMQNFLFQLTKSENVLGAHRHAINSLTSQIPLSWDWSWIQLRLNSNLLNNTFHNPLRPFLFNKSTDHTTKNKFVNQVRFINHRKFLGDYSIIRQINKKINEKNKLEILCLKSDNFENIELYLQETLRRNANNNEQEISWIYYQRLRLPKQKNPTKKETELDKYFLFLENLEDMNSYFEESTSDFSESLECDDKFLVIYNPPKSQDHKFDLWLSYRQNKGYKIVVLANYQFNSNIPSYTISIDSSSSLAEFNSLELPIVQKFIDQKDPKFLHSIFVLRIVHRLKNTNLHAEIFSLSEKTLWFQIFDILTSILTKTSFKLFIKLYLIRIKCTILTIRKLSIFTEIEETLDRLQWYQLIETNLDKSVYWVSDYIIEKVQQFKLISNSLILDVSKEISHQIIEIYSDKSNIQPLITSGFQNCLQEILDQDNTNIAITRLLQLSKKMIRLKSISYSTISGYTKIAIELAFLNQQKEIIWNTFFSSLDIIEKMLLKTKIIEIYEWILDAKEQEKDWNLVAKVQVKLAALYSDRDNKDKAIGLLTSAILLNKDLQNYSTRNENLISIAILFLELEAWDKLAKLIHSSNFDSKLLSEPDISKLWLIDGHLLIREKNYTTAISSFQKGLNLAKNIKEVHSFYAQSFIAVANLYLKMNEEESANNFANKAAEIMDSSEEFRYTHKLNHQLFNFFEDTEQWSKAIPYLKQLYNYSVNNKDSQETQKWAHKLGSIYFKNEEKDKSSEFYSLAQKLKHS